MIEVISVDLCVMCDRMSLKGNEVANYIDLQNLYFLVNHIKVSSLFTRCHNPSSSLTTM